MFMKFRLFLIKLLLGNKGLIANVEIDGGAAIEKEDRFLLVGGSDLWINKNGLELLNVTRADDYEIKAFEFDYHTRYFWREDKDDMRSELIEKYGTEDVKKDWLKKENRFKTHAESMGMTEEEYRVWYDENLLPY